MTIGLNIWMICLELKWLCYNPSWMFGIKMIMLQPELNVLLISMDVTFFGMSRFQQDKIRLAAIKITHFSP